VSIVRSALRGILPLRANAGAAKTSRPLGRRATRAPFLPVPRSSARVGGHLHTYRMPFPPALPDWRPRHPPLSLRARPPHPREGAGACVPASLGTGWPGTTPTTPCVPLLPGIVSPPILRAGAPVASAIRMPPNSLRSNRGACVRRRLPPPPPSGRGETCRGEACPIAPWGSGTSRRVQRHGYEPSQREVARTRCLAASRR